MDFGFLALAPLIAAAKSLLTAASVFFHQPELFFLSSAALVLATSLYFCEQQRLAFLAAAVAIALVVGYGFKLFVQAERPCVEMPSKIACPQDYSLPSMHALAAFTIAIVAIGTRSFPVYFSFALFIAFSRVYLGVHTIGEVAAGLSLAFFSCVLAELSFRAMRFELPSVVHLRHDIGKLHRTSAKKGWW